MFRKAITATDVALGAALADMVLNDTEAREYEMFSPRRFLP